MRSHEWRECHCQGQFREWGDPDWHWKLNSALRKSCKFLCRLWTVSLIQANYKLYLKISPSSFFSLDESFAQSSHICLVTIKFMRCSQNKFNSLLNKSHKKWHANDNHAIILRSVIQIRMWIYTSFFKDNIRKLCNINLMLLLKSYYDWISWKRKKTKILNRNLDFF